METENSAAAVSQRAAPISSGWLVSPAFDLCFLANLWWPLVLLVGALAGETDSWFGFWQIYFLTTPHRWLTLLLVATDRDRRAGKTTWLVCIALAAAATIVSVFVWRGELICLALVDYLWNAWHFGSQHGGMARIYARKQGARSTIWQTWGLRLLVVYTAMRMAGWMTGGLEADHLGTNVLYLGDLVVGSTCSLCAVAPLLQNRKLRSAWSIYVLSVVAIYDLLLMAVNCRAHGSIVALVGASAAFHAVEYMAFVTFYAKQRTSQGSAGLFVSMAQRWLALLLIYITLLGAAALFADRTWREVWLGINLWAAFVHYAFDGLIWKLRERRTSETLNVDLPPTIKGAT